MKSICITGAVQSELQRVANILHQAGMKQPEPGKNDNSVDIRFWHEQVMTLAMEDFGSAQSIVNPGRLWEQLASDIFVANIKSRIWGWSETYSTWLLDYWLDFEPHLNFILVSISPQQMLAGIMSSETEAISVEMVMNTWQSYHQELLRFHLRNPQRSLLVDFNECVSYPGNLVKYCTEQWKLPLTASFDAIQFEIAYDALAIYLAHQLCQDYPQVTSLQHELAATLTRFSEIDQVSKTIALSPAQIIADYRVLRDRSAELRQIQAAEEELANLRISFDEARASYTQKQKDNENVFSEATREIELLLQKLRQAQDELEAASVKHESQQAQIDSLSETNIALKAEQETLLQEKSVIVAQQEALKQEVTTLSKARHEQNTLANQRQAQIEVLKQERVSYANQVAERQARIDSLTQANIALKAEQEALLQEKSVIVAQQEALKQEVTTLSKARHEQNTLANQRQAQIEVLKQEHVSYANQAAERQARIDSLTQANIALKAEQEALLQEKSAIVAQQEALKQEVAALSKVRDEQSALANQRQAQIEVLKQERVSYANQAAERQARIDSLTQANIALKAEQEALLQEKSAIVTQQEALKQEVAALSKVRDEQSTLANQRQAQIEELKQERAGYANQAAEQQARVDSLTQANVALKAEQEALLQEKSATVAQQEALKQEVAALSKIRDEQSTLANQRQTQIEVLTQEHARHTVEKQAQIDSLTQANIVLKTDNELLLQEKSVLAAQHEALKQEVTALSKLRDEQTRNLAEHQAQLEFLNKTQTENSELLLLELHQAHLESEQYFQQQEEIFTRLHATEARWQRLLQRNPTYLDYETIEILSASLSEGGAITWQLTNFSIAERQLPILEFKTPLEQSMAGMIFTRLTEDNSLFTRWPASAKQQTELILMPMGERTTPQKFIETLFELATSDWNFIQTLTALLIEKLASPEFLKKHADIQAEAFRGGLEKFMQILKKLPATVRYDQVQLKSEQAIPGYEHLWLHFDNFSFNGKCWPEFEFRLACGNVQTNQFGTHPRLEFPEESGQAPFKTWFVESYDDFGTKLELRFAQPDSMDMAIWWRLTEHDRTFLAALIKRLPFILEAVQSSGGRLQRPWAEWNKMAAEIQRIFAMRTTVSLVPTPLPTVPTPVASVKPALPSTSASFSEEPKQTQEPISVVKTTGKSSTQTASKTSTAKSALGSKRRKVQK
ncbi:hypothetical protein [Nitrosomonas communis]|uniref:Uncharacterized protein n=1 Tax=Nitrosomonas communis TaxID=44574 RepID=A0A1I4MRY9_9PROT|nr:hypothetical protein [Nitrosomonas communis]SFM06052.1 hypothetical protein SAMN05421863_101160 [Nitrosomonas communis]